MATVSQLHQPEPGLHGAVSAAVESMSWLTAADRGMVALALEYARQIDAADDGKAVGFLGQNLTIVLKALGGAPAERKALGVEQEVRGKLSQLRAARQ
jgi:hypothetical protein